MLIKVDDSLIFRGYVVKVVFNDFMLETFSSGDVLKFYDGMNAVSSLLGSYSRTTHPEVIYSTGRYLFVKFLTDSIFIYRGFSFTVSAVKEGTSTVYSLQLFNFLKPCECLCNANTNTPSCREVGYIDFSICLLRITGTYIIFYAPESGISLQGSESSFKIICCTIYQYGS